MSDGSKAPPTGGGPSSKDTGSALPSGIASLEDQNVTTRDHLGRQHSPYTSDRYSMHAHGTQSPRNPIPEHHLSQHDHRPRKPPSSYASLASASRFEDRYSPRYSGGPLSPSTNVPDFQNDSSSPNHLPLASSPRSDWKPTEDKGEINATSSAENPKELDDFEKSEMAKVVAKNIAGTNTHQELLQTLRGFKAGVLSSRINEVFPKLEKEVELWCGIYHIPNCLSVFEVFRELDQVQSQYDENHCLRFFVADNKETSGIGTSSALQQHEEPMQNTGSEGNKGVEGSQTTRAEDGSSKYQAGVESKEAAIGVETVKDSSDDEDLFTGDSYDSTETTAEVTGAALDCQADVQTREDPPRINNDSQGNSPAPDAGTAANETSPKATTSVVDKEPADVLSLRMLLRSKKRTEGLASLQVLLCLVFRDKAGKPWPKRRREFNAFVMELWTHKTTLPEALREWMRGHMEGYPTSHLPERATFLAGRLVSKFSRAKLLLKLEAKNSKKQSNNKLDWDLDHVKAVTDLYQKQEGPKRDQREPAACGVKVEAQDDVEVVELQRPVRVKQEATNGNQSSHMDQSRALPDPMAQHTENQELACTATANKGESNAANSNIEDSKDCNIGKLLESVETSSDGCAAMELLLILNENYKGRTWPATRRDFKMCVQAVAATVKKQPHNQQGKLPMKLYQHIQGELNRSTIGIVVPSLLKMFLQRFQEVKCVDIKEKDDPKLSQLVWKMERVDAITDYLREHPLRHQKQQKIPDGIVSESTTIQQQRPEKPKANKPAKIAPVCDLIEIEDSDEEEERVCGSEPRKLKGKSGQKTVGDWSLPRKSVKQHGVSQVARLSSRGNGKHAEVPFGSVSCTSRGEKTYAQTTKASPSIDEAARNQKPKLDLLATTTDKGGREADTVSCKRHKSQDIAGSRYAPERLQAPSAAPTSTQVRGLQEASSRHFKSSIEQVQHEAADPSNRLSSKRKSSCSLQSREETCSKGGDSLVTLAALDVLFVLNAIFPTRKWPNKPKTLSSWLGGYTERKYKRLAIPNFLEELRRDIERSTRGKPSFGKLFSVVTSELVRLGTCSNVFKWNYDRVRHLLRQHKTFPHPRIKAQSFADYPPTSQKEATNSSKRKRQRNSSSPSKTPAELRTSNPERSQEQSFSLLAPRAQELIIEPLLKKKENSSTCLPPNKANQEEVKKQTGSVPLQEGNTSRTLLQVKPISGDANSAKQVQVPSTKLGFDVARGYAMVSVEQVEEKEPCGILLPSPPLVSNDIQVLLDLLPQDLVTHLSDITVQMQVSEIVLDKGRPLVAWSGSGRLNLASASRSITENDIAGIVDKIGGFGSDNRAGLDEQLHRVAAVRNRQQEIVGLTFQVRSRYVSGGASMIADILYGDPDKSVLFLGEPGSGKTTLLREVAHGLAEKSKVVIVDSCSEIGGDGDIPHPAIGLARRIMVPSLKEQASVIAQCSQNHNPEVMVIDRIGLPDQVEAVRSCKDQCIRLIGSAQGSFQRLVWNPRLQGLIGGNSGMPIFDIIVVLQSPHEWTIIRDASAALDYVVKGQKYEVQHRSRNPITGDIHLKSEKV